MLLVVVLAVVAVPFGAALAVRNAGGAGCGADGPGAVVVGAVSTIEGLAESQVRLAKIIWSRARAQESRLGTGEGVGDAAAVIAIAVASQESTLGRAPTMARPNADGDAGPFQQRTKPGWYGTLAQVSDPVYAADTFLLGHSVTKAEHGDALAAGSQPAGPVGYHIPGLANVARWQELSVVEAANRVQRSAFPDAVADDIPMARQLVATFRGGVGLGPVPQELVGVADCESAKNMACPASGSPAEKGVQPDTLLVIRCVSQEFPKIKTFYGQRPDALDDHPSGRAVDIMISSAYEDIRGAAAVTYGSQIAEWIKEHRIQLGVHYIIWRQRIWNVERANEGWRPMADRGGDTANHLDHIHVTTYGNAARPTAAEVSVAMSFSGQAVTPVERYTITARFGDIGSWARYHTGLDFAAPIGTPVRAALGGVVTHAGYGAAAPWAGNYLTIRHPDGTSTLYAHLVSHDVSEGQAVETGQRIGAIGLTGRTFGPHLHFETYPQGDSPGRIYQATDPAAWLNPKGPVDDF